jgi:hypothetical protein
MRITLFLILILCLAGPAPAQRTTAAPPLTQVTAAALRAQLAAMKARDQEGRNQLLITSTRDGLPLGAPQYADQRKRQRAIDRSNQAQLDAIVLRYGWPGKRLLGDEAAAGAFAIVAHAGLDYQRRYLPVLRAAVAAGQATGSDLALLEAHVRARAPIAQPATR